MSNNAKADLPDFAMNASNLYKDETITDSKVGSIRVLTPIKPDGKDDHSRPTLFAGQAQLMTPAGVLPINFDIDAKDLAEAVNLFGDAAKVGMEETIKKLEDMRREAASKIVVPGQEGGMGGPESKLFMP
jgi:hypothetical protein